MLKKGTGFFKLSEVPDSVSKIIHYQEFVKKLGGNKGHATEAKDSERLVFGFDTESIGEFLPKEQVLQKPYMGIVLGSSWESKDWTVAGYRSFLERAIASFEENFVLLGDSSHKTRASEICDGMMERHFLILL